MLIKKEKLESLLGLLAEEAQLLVPAQIAGNSKFVPYEKGLQVDLELVNTLLPPKDVLFPQTEKMYHYSRQQGQLRIDESRTEGRCVIFGIRPCDMQSLLCLDDVFLTKGYEDSFYARRRAQLLLIAVGCTEAAETCFCTSMGLDPGAAPGADLLLKPTAGGWLAEAQTESGRGVLTAAVARGLLVDADSAALPLPSARCAVAAEIGGVAQKLGQMFEHPLWAELQRGCIGCGTCTYVCPTCYCFEIANHDAGGQGFTFRCWDSCMFSEYSRMAGGHNPRPSKTERLRNRYLHKLSYFQERYGKHLCVGCGRCLSKCPAGLDIITVIERVGEVEAL